MPRDEDIEISVNKRPVTARERTVPNDSHKHKHRSARDVSRDSRDSERKHRQMNRDVLHNTHDDNNHLVSSIKQRSGPRPSTSSGLVFVNLNYGSGDEHLGERDTFIQENRKEVVRGQMRRHSQGSFSSRSSSQRSCDYESREKLIHGHTTFNETFEDSDNRAGVTQMTRNRAFLQEPRDDTTAKVHRSYSAAKVLEYE